MIDSGLQLDLFCYTCFISGFCNLNMMPEAREVFSEMIGHGIAPDRAVYNCLISKYQKLGNLEEAISLQDEMERVLPSCTDSDTATDGKT